MWENDFTSNEHQVVHADSGPVSSTSVAAYTQLCARFPGFVEEEPNLFALLDSAASTGCVGTIIENKWNHHLGRFDGGAHDDKILSRHVCLLCFALECRLCHDPRFEAHTDIRAQLLLRDTAFPLSGRGGGVGGSALAGRGRFGGARIGLTIIVNTKRELALAGYLALLLEQRLGYRCSMLCKLVRTSSF
jgi:hypothetical protein